MEDVRKMRAACQEVETGLSMLRRVVQGRLDIVGLELTRRAEGGDPGDLPDLIARLPEVLSDRTRAPGVGRLPQMMSPAEMPPELEAELDAILGAGRLAEPRRPRRRRPADPRVGAGRPSSRRCRAAARSLFDRIDALQAEITRRYKTGEATIDALLQ